MRRSDLLFLMVWAVAVAPAGAQKGATGPRTTYEKAAESTTGGSGETARQKGAGACLSIPEPGDVHAVMDTFRRQSRLAEDLRERFLEADRAHEKRLDQLKELDRQLGEAQATERAIAQSQPKSPQLAEVRQVVDDLRRQKERLAAFDQAHERDRQRLIDRASEARRCAEQLAARRHELRQGKVEDRRGTVEVRRRGRSGGWSAPEDEIVLHPGDAVRTGADGGVRLRLPDGSVLDLGPSAGFTLSSDPGILGEQLAGKIRYMIQQYLRKMEVRTPAAVCGIRGTEFSLHAAEGKATELTAVDGKVEFTARPPAQGAKPGAWWAAAAAAGVDAPSADALARLGEGPARVKRRGGAWETARAGDPLQADDLVRADAAPVAMRLAGGVTAVLAPGSVLQARQDQEGRPQYGLWRGRLYGRRPAGAQGPEPLFTAPTAVCAVRGTEFEYHVPAGEAPEFTIYDGSIEVTADETRFQDPERFRDWWED